MLRCYNKWRRYTGLRLQNDDNGVLTLPALLGGRTTRFARKRLVVFGLGGSLEHSDGEQDAHKGETPQNHDQGHTAAGLVTVPGSTSTEAAPCSFVRSVILISKSGELGRHFPLRRSSTFTSDSLKVNRKRVGSEVCQAH